MERNHLQFFFNESFYQNYGAISSGVLFLEICTLAAMTVMMALIWRARNLMYNFCLFYAKNL